MIDKTWVNVIDKTWDNVINKTRDNVINKTWDNVIGTRNSVIGENRDNDMTEGTTLLGQCHK